MRGKSNGRPCPRFFGLLGLLCVIFGLFSGCAPSPDHETFFLQTEAYAHAIEAAGSKEAPRPVLRQEHQPNLYTMLGQYAAVEAYDAQVAPLLQDPAYHWYPHYVATVVIAVDRRQTDQTITGFGDLPAAGQEVGIPAEDPDFRLMLPALSYLLEGEFSLTGATALLAQLQRGGHLRQGDPAAPIQILFDYQAVALIRQGRELEIILPSEGTLSFTKGLISRHALRLPQGLGDVLVDAGLRLPDGSCDPGLYPAAAEYQRVVSLPDYSRLAEAGQNAWRDFRRKGMRIRLYSTADNREHMLSAMLLIALVIAWSGDNIRRVMSRKIRILFFAAAMLLVLWVILRMFKYQIRQKDALDRFLWYCYYVFQLGLPVVLLRITDLVGKGEDTPPPLWWKLCVGLHIGLLVLVLTNDWHQLVFRFDWSGDWSKHYTYGPGYVLLAGINVICFLGAVLLLLSKGKKSPRRWGMAIPVLFTAYLIFYAALYMLRVPIAWESDFTITVCLFSLLFLQSAIHSGLIPLNTKYTLLFTHSPMAMELLDTEGRAVITSAAPPAQAGALPRRSAIRGGMVAWREDLSAIHALQKQLASTVADLEKSNAILQYRHRIDTDLETLAAQKRIQGELDQLLSSQFAEIGALLESAEAHNAKSVIARVGLLLCYAKRRCNLMFWEKQSQTVSVGELNAYFDEIGRFAKEAGVLCALMPPLEGDLSIAAAIACYGFLFEGLWQAVIQQQKELIVRMSEREGAVVMQLLSDQPLTDCFSGGGMPGCRIAFRADGYLYEAELAVEGGILLYA